MPRLTLLPLFFLLSLAFNGCSGQQKYHRSACNLESITAQGPTIQIQAEAGVAEFWDYSSPEAVCTAVVVERLTVEPKGLILPHQGNAQHLYFVVQGRAVHGSVIPGCAETFESPVQGQSSVDRNQEVVRVTQGDVVAVVAGITHWIYNDGDVPLILVGVTDLGNPANQLDLQYRLFWLAGNSQNHSQQEQEQGQGQGQQGQGQQELLDWENIWNGFDDEFLSEILRVPQEIVQKLKGQESNRRGGIVRAENLNLSLPEFDQEENQHQQCGSGSRPNGFEETICTLKIRENIAHPARADIYNPGAGRVSTVNSQTLPILQVLRLSALHANLHSNALWAPSWTSNANTLLYVIRGSARIQIVGDTRSSAFDGEVSQGQLIVVPQNFVVLKKAGDQGLEFIAFKTSDNALTNSLAGRLSALWALPEDIIAASFRIPKEEVRRLRYGREEAQILSGSEPQGRNYAIVNNFVS